MTKCLQLRTCAPSSPAHPPLHLELFTILLLGTYAYITVFQLLNVSLKRFPHSSVGKESACNAGDANLIPGSRRSPGEGKGYPLQYSGLENSMDCIAHGVTKSRTRLSALHLKRLLLQHWGLNIFNKIFCFFAFIEKALVMWRNWTFQSLFCVIYCKRDCSFLFDCLPVFRRKWYYIHTAVMSRLSGVAGNDW